MFDVKKFGACISRLRKSADLTVAELAVKLGAIDEGMSFADMVNKFNS